MQLGADVIQVLQMPMIITWQAIASDFIEGLGFSNQELTNEVAVEGCIDADRLYLNGGSKEANDLVMSLVIKHGYDAVLTALSHHFRLV